MRRVRTHYTVPSYNQVSPELPCAIHCARCEGEAYLDSPFEFMDNGAAKAASADPSISGVKLGGGFVVEKYPKIFPWRSPENLRMQARLYGRAREVWGVCSCGSCGCRKKHLLRWPEEAYYKTTIRGEVIWAWTRDQAVALRALIASKDRKIAGATRKHFWFLRHIPKHFLEVKHRTEALKKLDRLLSAG